MKKLLTIFLIISMLFLTSCFGTNETYANNKKVLDENYQVDTNYAVLSGRTYQTADKVIDFGKLVNQKLFRDGKGVKQFYNTRFESTLAEDKIYFFYEYKRVEDIGKFAIGYVDLDTLKVYADYFEHERRGFSWEYQFSTDKFVVYKFYERNGTKDIKIVFFKDTNKLEFDYSLGQLKYDPADFEEVATKDYYIENGVKYTLEWNKVINTETGEEISLLNGNELRDTVPLIKEIYDRFVYEDIEINLSYLSNGEELFFYINDRPTNSANAPIMLFKCNLDLSSVSYIGYYNWLVFDVVNLTSK